MLLIAGGSPSRMRGKELHVGILLCGIGITPAYAGKRPVAKLSISPPWDHPRICGEKTKRGRRDFQARGSPPHMRGKDCCATLGKTPVGITPAYAGKSGAHVSFRTAPLGSPPHMRGKDWMQGREPEFRRITPAYAGKSQRGPEHLAATVDHPRVCGEKA